MSDLQPRLAWLALIVVLLAGLAGVSFMGVRTYQDAPPIPAFVAPDGRVVASHDDVLRGQAVFQRYALMDYGSMFGDGAGRGPDFTADALHTITLSMLETYGQGLPAGTDLETAGVLARVQREIKANHFDAATDRVQLTPGQAAAFPALVRHYQAMFTGQGPETFKPAHYLTKAQDIQDLTAFFYWGAWVCGAARPGQASSYTHNWPFDELAGNRPSPAVMLWSVLGLLGLVIGLGLTLFARGKLEGTVGFRADGEMRPFVTPEVLASFKPSPSQKATYKFFATAAVLFGLQVLAGVLTVHDFLGFTHFFGVDISTYFPITVVRSWHLQWGLMWIVACWIGASIFVMPMLMGEEPEGQAPLVNLLYALVVTLVAGSAVGIYLGPTGVLGSWWNTLGNQGWEFVELGRLWQGLLMGALALWCWIMFRGVRAGLRHWDPTALHSWLTYTILVVLLLFLSGFVATPRTNFVIADFWRWMVIHMWVEAFLEVFTTIIVGAFMVMMGLASQASATRVVAMSALLFLGSGILGISHNFYWNAKPVETLALGSIFSTLQVVPLLLLALEAWRTRQLPSATGGPAPFAQSGAFLFLLGVNFWNFYGAGVLGLVINLPIVNYYEHGTYLTVNHGHAAFMGVYGNLSIAALLFCVRYLAPAECWNEKLVKVAFWSLNSGLMLMVLLDLFPVGVIQFQATLDHGLWFARSLAFVGSETFQRLTWLRAIGGYVFTFGGVVPLFWFVFTSWRAAGARPHAGDLGEPPAHPARATSA